MAAAKNNFPQPIFDPFSSCDARDSFFLLTLKIHGPWVLIGRMVGNTMKHHTKTTFDKS